MADTVGAPEGNTVGASLPEDQVEWKPRLAGFGEGKVVTILNPLTSNFRVQYARSTPVNVPLSEEAKVAQEKGGISMTKDMGQSTGHYPQYLVLKAGETQNLPGDIAQKAVQDLVTYILMQRAGKGNPKNVSDGFARSQVEKEIIIAVHDNTTFFNNTSTQPSAEEQIEQLNYKPVEETPAPVEDEGATVGSSKVSKATRKA